MRVEGNPGKCPSFLQLIRISKVAELFLQGPGTNVNRETTVVEQLSSRPLRLLIRVERMSKRADERKKIERLLLNKGVV